MRNGIDIKPIAPAKTTTVNDGVGEEDESFRTTKSKVQGTIIKAKETSETNLSLLFLM